MHIPLRLEGVLLIDTYTRTIDMPHHSTLWGGLTLKNYKRFLRCPKLQAEAALVLTAEACPSESSERQEHVRSPTKSKDRSEEDSLLRRNAVQRVHPLMKEP